MSNAVYSFLPWFRQGIGGLIAGAPGALRASVSVTLKITGEPLSGNTPLEAPVNKNVELYGPGDIVGIDPRAVIRTDPHDWITNAEPNYLAHIEFYEEDFPWRYSPSAPFDNSLKLQPWLALVVLAEGEFDEGKNLNNRPLPFIKVNSLSSLPPHDQLWAWAHVHVDESLSANDDEFVSPNMNAVLPKLGGILNANADRGYSRIVCPRKLSENTAYYAFLIPSFETGRLAGLGLAVSGVSLAAKSAWSDGAAGPEPQLIPVYHRWHFRTGKSGDFEDLVRLLQPRTVDPKVGLRDMDVQNPSPIIPGILEANLRGVLKLGGALRAPKADKTAVWIANEAWDAANPHPFQKALAAFVNLADDYQTKPPKDALIAANGEKVTTQFDTDEDEKSPDPVITPPLYGRWHAAVDRLLVKADGSAVENPGNWIQELNLDPRFRVGASAGTKVIQKDQEEFMRAAWSQVGDVIEANRKLRLSQFARQISNNWFERRFLSAASSDDRFLRLSRPVHRRVLDGGKTLRSAFEKSLLTTSLMSSTATRLMRPGGRLARHLGGGRGINRDQLLMNLNVGKLLSAPKKTAPRGVLSLTRIVAEDIKKLMSDDNFPRNRIEDALLASRLLSGGTRKLEEFDGLRRPDLLEVTDPDSKRPSEPRGSREEAVRIHEAAREWQNLVGASRDASERAEPLQINIASAKSALADALHPLKTIRARTLHTLAIPPRISAALEEQFDEILHHPVIDTPMYKPLEQLSKEFFLPNLNLIPPDSITLVETNQPFIESYMVGLNHEFSRELLWREYPTDQRASVFRQFWDVKSLPLPPAPTPEESREKLRDIPKLHRWPRKSRLGDHDNREKPGDNENEIVLVIRGELLKKYPNTVIYAQRAKWDKTNGALDFQKERLLEDVTDADLLNPPDALLRFPIFDAKVDPDIYFFGFDLTADAAKGGNPDSANPDPGWYFILKERPGEPRFGFDTKSSGQKHTFNDVAWPDLAPLAQGQFIDSATAIALTAGNLPPDAGEKIEQRKDDLKLAPAPVSAARWAYIMYQAPVMVAVHAAEMLKQLSWS